MSYHPKDYTITWDGTNVSAFTGGSSDATTSGGVWRSDGPNMVWEDWEDPVILEDGPWSPLYEYEDYEGIMHAVLATELGLDEEDI